MASDYTVSFGGITIGNGTAIPLMNATGFEDLPDVRTDDVDLGYAWGETPGTDYSAGRDIVLDFLILDSGSGDFFTTVEAVKAASIIGSETTMTFQLPGRVSRSISCRPRRRSIPVTPDYQFRYGLASIEFHATDPRIYDAAASNSLPVFVSGSAGFKMSLGAGVDLGVKMTLGAGVDLGLKFTGISGTGLVTCTNAGSVNTYPVMTFSAPAGMSQWSVTNQTTGQVFSVVQTLGAGETLIADMKSAATGRSSLPISISGASRYGSWQAPRTPFALVPGANVLRFDVTTGDPNAACLISWQSATL